MQKKNLDSIISELFSSLSGKQAKVLAGRFGLSAGKKLTLQEIGDALGVTRERVRQIESQGLKKLKSVISESAGWIIDAADKHLSHSGGVRENELFLSELLKKTGLSVKKYPKQKIAFILFSAGSPCFYKEDEEYNAFWYEDKKAEKKFFDFVKSIRKFFEGSDKSKILDKKAYFEYLTDLVSAHMLSIPKCFGTNPFGDFGLKKWPEIEPKTIRDKAHLALKKNSKPLHFREIAKQITRLGIDKKPAHVQTVHNELIKDERFVLVGRGVYALRESGYEPGTVREVIAGLLKQKGPLSSVDVVRLVNERRFLKENTILLNLQNRKFFKRLDGGKYHLREA